MGTYEDRAKNLWSLATSGLGTTISAAGNSGTWGDTAPAPYPSSPISLSPASDILLTVYATGKTSTPTFAVQLGFYDDQGNLFTPTALVLSITTSGSAPYFGFLAAGVRAGSGGSNTYIPFPQYGQVSWTCTGGSVTGVSVNLWGR